MSTYPAAYYIPVLDGVAAALTFKSLTSAAPYDPVTGYPASPVTTNMSSAPAILEVQFPVGPTPSSLDGGATWAGAGGTPPVSVSRNGSTGVLTVAFNGNLPAMTAGAYPSGCILREHSWQVESGVSPSIVASAFTDLNDVNTPSGFPYNEHPIYFVPYFGGYSAASLSDTSHGLTCSSSGTTFDPHWGLVLTLTLVLHKPLNQNQHAADMSFVITSSSGTFGGIPQVALPSGASAILQSGSTIPTALFGGGQVTAQTNSSGQITGFTFVLMLDDLSPGTLAVDTMYNFTLTVTQQLTYYYSGGLSVDDTITICEATLGVYTTDDSTGPVITEAMLSPTYGSGLMFDTASMGGSVILYGGYADLTVAADDPAWGILLSSFNLKFEGGAQEAFLTGTGSSPWTLPFNTRSTFSGSQEPGCMAAALSVCVTNGHTASPATTSNHDVVPEGSTSTIAFANIDGFVGHVPSITTDGSTATPSSGNPGVLITDPVMVWTVDVPGYFLGLIQVDIATDSLGTYNGSDPLPGYETETVAFASGGDYIRYTGGFDCSEMVMGTVLTNAAVAGNGNHSGVGAGNQMPSPAGAITVDTTDALRTVITFDGSGMPALDGWGSGVSHNEWAAFNQSVRLTLHDLTGATVATWFGPISFML